MKKKAFGVFAVLMALFGASVWSLTHISGSAEYVAAALGQSEYRLDVAKARGTIYDRNGLPLVGGETRILAAVAPTIEAVGALEKATGGRERDRLRTALEDGKPFLLELDPAEGSQVRGVRNITLFQVPVRMGQNQLAVHLLGMTDSLGSGVSGIELAMDDVLARQGGEASVTYQVDALGRVMAGGGTEVSDTLEDAKAGVMLTLDSRIQKIAEGAGAALGKGAVVVTEVPACEVRAMASFPGYSPDNLAIAVKDGDAPLLNRALCAYAPGSVFKLTVAAAVLERGLPLQNFTCTGAVNAGGMLFHCYDGIPHGTVGMKEALEQSCNCYFINCGRSLGGQAVLSMAYDLGLGEEQEFGRGLFMDAGNLPKAEELTNERALANFSFGQGPVTVTPLQMCGVVNAIAAGGIYHSPRLITGTVDREGRLTEALPVTEREIRVMKESTALILQNAMEGAVKEGTARRGDPGNGVAGVKTGTAQTGAYLGGQELLNFWYCGYVRDQDGPRYCITVLAESTPDDEGAAARVFRETAQQLLALTD